MEDGEFMLVREAARRLRKSASQVRRDVKGGRLNAFKEGGRISVRYDSLFRAHEGRVSAQNSEVSVDSAAASQRETSSPDGLGHVARRASSSVLDEIIEELRDTRIEVARLAAKVRLLETRGDI